MENSRKENIRRILQLVEDGTYKALAEKYELDLNNLCLLTE